jgi:hypothetical protein
MAQRIASTSYLAFVSCLVLAGCNSTPAPPPADGSVDANLPPDAYMRPDAFVLDSCDPSQLHVLMGMPNATVGIDLDTTMSSARPRDLGLGCGNTAADARWANQQVIEFHVPGTGMQGVTISTNNTMTQANFNTVLEVRTGDCRAVPTSAIPPSCFDDVSATDLLSEGGLTVMGGAVVYVFVTGYSNPPAMEMAVAQGTVHVDFHVAPNTAPVLTAGTATFSGVDTVVSATGTDAEGPFGGYTIAFYNAMGQIDLNGDGMINGGDQLLIPFDTITRMAPMYTGNSHINGMTQYRLADYCHQAAVHCTQFGLRVFDEQYAFSNELRVDVHDAQIVGSGATCDVLHLCAAGLACTGGTCSVTAAATMQCNAAMPLMINTPTTSATTSTVSNNIASGMGTFNGSCGMSTGRANIWAITIPMGDFDLALTTDLPATGMGDTVLYVRSNCVDQTTELPMGCNDDINTAGGNYRSQLSFRDLAPGTYYIFVTSYAGQTAFPYAMRATLTPVLATGAACDPSMTNYRCANGACGATSHVCP